MCGSEGSKGEVVWRRVPEGVKECHGAFLGSLPMGPW